MDIRRVVRLPNGQHVARISVAMFLRSVWHILNGQRLRRHLEWKRASRAESEARKVRSERSRRGWDTRRRNADVTRAIEAFENFPHICSCKLGPALHAGPCVCECGNPTPCTGQWWHSMQREINDGIEGAPV